MKESDVDNYDGSIYVDSMYVNEAAMEATMDEAAAIESDMVAAEDHYGPHHDKDGYDKPEQGMHDKPMNHTDDDWWYPEDEYHYASSTSTIVLSMPIFILTMINK